VDARASVSENVVGGGQDAVGFSIAEASDEFRVRFVVAIVDASSASTATVAAQVVTKEAHIVAKASIISEFDIDAFTSRTDQSLGSKLAYELGFSILQIKLNK